MTVIPCSAPRYSNGHLIAPKLQSLEPPLLVITKVLHSHNAAKCLNSRTSLVRDYYFFANVLGYIDFRFKVDLI